MRVLEGLGFTCLGVRVVISGVISPLIWVMSIVALLITLLVTAHEPPSIFHRRSDLQHVTALCSALNTPNRLETQTSFHENEANPGAPLRREKP